MAPIGRYFVIKSQMSGLVFDVEGGSVGAGVPVIMYEQHNGDNQLWYFDTTRDVIRSKADDTYVLDVDDDGYLVVNEYAQAVGTQHWMVVDEFLRCLATGKVADVESASTDSGAKVIAWEQHGGDNQKWTLEYQPRQYFEIRSKMNDKALDIQGAEKDPGAKIQMYESHGGDNQLWYEDRWGNIYSKLNGLTIKSTDDGLVTAPLDMSEERTSWMRCGASIESREDRNHCLDIQGCCDDDGASVQSYEWHGGDNQCWYYHFV